VIAVLGAINAEIQEFLEHTDAIQEELWGRFVFYRGILAGRKVVIARTGVGKVLSAMLTQRLLDVYQPDALIFTGVAGALRSDLDIGDVVVARDCMQHDFDATPVGILRGEIPYTGYRVFPCDQRLVSAAASWPGNGHRVVTGRVLTGDQFFTAGQLASYRYLVDELHGDAIEMEGASVGLVAMVNEVPFVIIRTISDRADTNAMRDFEEFLPEASRNSFRIVQRVLRVA
jgi:5'-methylthioadenosine/S-adenosylhomocysteine nucleosidase